MGYISLLDPILAMYQRFSEKFRSFSTIQVNKFDKFAHDKAQAGRNLSGLSTTHKYSRLNILVLFDLPQFQVFVAIFTNDVNLDHIFMFALHNFSRGRWIFLDYWNLALGTINNIRGLVNQSTANSITSFRGSTGTLCSAALHHILLSRQFQ